MCVAAVESTSAITEDGTVASLLAKFQERMENYFMNFLPVANFFLQETSPNTVTGKHSRFDRFLPNSRANVSRSLMCAISRLVYLAIFDGKTFAVQQIT